jgi:hypothetical protein
LKLDGIQGSSSGFEFISKLKLVEKLTGQYSQEPSSMVENSSKL